MVEDSDETRVMLTRMLHGEGYNRLKPAMVSRPWKKWMSFLRI